MGRYISIEKYVDVDVDMDDFDDDDIRAEFESRGLGEAPEDTKELIQHLYQKRRTGQNYEQELDQLIYNVLGRLS